MGRLRAHVPPRGAVRAGIRSGRFSPALGFVALSLGAIVLAGPLGPPASQAAQPRRGSCPAARATWSPTEKDVWERSLCRGDIADLRGKPDSNRKLSGVFLANVLLDEPWRSALPRQGVRILGAVFDDEVSLGDADLGGVLWLEDCVFREEVFLSQARSPRLISFDRSEFRKPLRLNSVKLGAGLFLRDVVAREHPIQLWGASIEDAVFLSGARLESVFMQQARVGGDVVMKAGASIDYLQLSNATVGGSLVIGAKGQQAVVSKLLVAGSKIAGRVAITDATIETPILLRFASIGGNLEISGGTLPAIDLTGATIAGELQLKGPLTWVGDTPSILRNATARVIRVHGEPWPRKVDLRGFQFQLLGDGRGPSPSAARTDSRHVAPLLEWLARSSPYSPQPYQQVAQVLESGGDESGARQVRFAAREEERRLARGWAKAWLTAKWAVIGHGFHLERAWYWVIALLILGTAVVRLSGEAKRLELGWGLAFSFDRLVPVIRLREEHYRVDLRPGVRHYFYVHQITGYVLASFLVAGLSGLTK